MCPPKVKSSVILWTLLVVVMTLSDCFAGQNRSKAQKSETQTRQSARQAKPAKNSSERRSKPATSARSSSPARVSGRSASPSRTINKPRRGRNNSPSQTRIGSPGKIYTKPNARKPLIRHSGSRGNLRPKEAKLLPTITDSVEMTVGHRTGLPEISAKEPAGEITGTGDEPSR